MDASGSICAEAELAWPEKKVAVLLPEQAQYEARFSEQGWTVFLAALLADGASTLQNALTDTQPKGFIRTLLESLARLSPFNLI
jgi:hypothetical protein